MIINKIKEETILVCKDCGKEISALHIKHIRQYCQDCHNKKEK